MSTAPRAESPLVIVLVGPTASGKSEVALELAPRLGAEIISADSRQVYKELDIGTAKPHPEALRAVKHHFVDEIPPDREFSAGEFGEKGRRLIAALLARGKRALVVGGSGLYLRSLIDGLFEGPGASHEIRQRLEREVDAGHTAELLEELRRVDPEGASHADPTKPRRIIRALEVHALTGRPLSQLQHESRLAPTFEARQFGLLWDREELYRRIEHRCDEMLSRGLLDEVEKLERMGYDARLNALNTVGYAEAFAYRRGETSYSEMVRLFKQNSRRYAKRQMTWFRADKRIHWIPMVEGRSALDVAVEIERGFLASGSAFSYI
jgi:tRNA dimethylallyltransferase